jgi:hypothetical protein
MVVGETFALSYLSHANPSIKDGLRLKTHFTYGFGSDPTDSLSLVLPMKGILSNPPDKSAQE